MSTALSSHVCPELLQELKQAGVISALPDLRSHRLRKYLRQPACLIRDGWRLSADCSFEHQAPRSYVLGVVAMGQRLCLDRQRGVITLLTYHRSQAQEICFDLHSDQVICNQVA